MDLIYTGFNNKLSNVIITNPIPVPSYLSCFETEFPEINLIYDKRSSISFDSDKCPPIKHELIDENAIKEETVEECDLTGDPLKVDLGDDDIEIDNIEQTVSLWSNQETNHFPLTVTDGRRELNRLLKNPDPASSSLPIYVVCSGDDPHNTILLGAERDTLMACGVHALGIVELEENEMEIEEMVNDHYKNCNRENIQINYLVKIGYNVYGKTLRNLSRQDALMRNFEEHASVSVEVISHEPVFKVLEDTKLQMVMNLEIIAGHQLLRIHFLWEELHTLQTYTDILSNRLEEDTILCDDPLDEDQILVGISNLVKVKYLKPVLKKNDINLDNLREGDFLDELWNILKRCETASVLQNSFHFLFEELTNSDIRVLNIKDKYSGVASIIIGVLNRNIILSAITLSQCVELLFELGAQKLKFDFEVLLKYCSSMANRDIESVWSSFYPTEEQKKQSTVRTTRVTQYLSTSSSPVKSKQLAYLTQLYVAAEFIYFVKEQVYLQEHNFSSFCEHIEKEYVKNSNVFEEFLEVYQSPLCQTSFPFLTGDVAVISSLFPSRWTMYMISEVGSTQVTTIYDLSKSPVFPPNIYNYDDPILDRNMVYYLAKINRTKEL